MDGMHNSPHFVRSDFHFPPDLAAYHTQLDAFVPAAITSAAPPHDVNPAAAVFGALDPYLPSPPAPIPAAPSPPPTMTHAVPIPPPPMQMHPSHSLPASLQMQATPTAIPASIPTPLPNSVPLPNGLHIPPTLQISAPLPMSDTLPHPTAHPTSVPSLASDANAPLQPDLALSPAPGTAVTPNFLPAAATAAAFADVLSGITSEGGSSAPSGAPAAPPADVGTPDVAAVMARTFGRDEAGSPSSGSRPGAPAPADASAETVFSAPLAEAPAKTAWGIELAHLNAHAMAQERWERGAKNKVRSKNRVEHRLEVNRKSAWVSRDRRREYVKQLERVVEYGEQNTLRLQREVVAVDEERCRLKEQLAYLQNALKLYQAV